MRTPVGGANFPLPVGVENGQGYVRITAEASVLAKTGQTQIPHVKTVSLERTLILPARLQFTQQISNFERIRDIDLRRRIIGGGDRFSTTRWPLLRVARGGFDPGVRGGPCGGGASH